MIRRGTSRFRGQRRGALVVPPCMIAAWLMLLLPACDERGIEVHRVEKGVERVPGPLPGGAGDLGGHRESTGAENGWPWVLPAGWVVDETPRSMRLATFQAPGPSGLVEVAVTRFDGRVGGELANVNRWRGQVGLGPISDAELEGSIRRFSTEGFEGYEARIDGDGVVMLAAGVYEAAEDRTWFVRTTVEPDAAGALEAEVFAFARSIASGATGEGGR